MRWLVPLFWPDPQSAANRSGAKRLGGIAQGQPASRLCLGLGLRPDGPRPRQSGDGYDGCRVTSRYPGLPPSRPRQFALISARRIALTPSLTVGSVAFDPVGHADAPLLVAPSKHHSLEGHEHDRTIPLTDAAGGRR